ncbi:hypothetical protein [Candidatus Arsenophonus triatominarum]|uniref:hypothetical protein n=1 Tax=Candidatus Arsenophonus triatominarum TaxID=57911 RepID=UPI0007C4DF00|nr:hypothetical protein [Candidatus Arsenophonus triatominarum]
MSIKIHNATNIFINNNIINLKENDKNNTLLYIKNFFYQIITFGLKRSLFEARAEEKKELFNMAFSVFKAMPLSFGDIKKDYQRDMYFSPCRKNKIYQCEYNIYISKLDRNGDEIIDSRIELANLSKREYFEKFKKKFSEIKEHDSYKKIVDNNYKIISELKYFNINILNNLKEVAIRYTIENSSNYLNVPDNIELKKKLEKTSCSFKEYIENKIETDNFGMDDIMPIVHFFLESDEELQKILLNTDIHESYMFDVIDDKNKLYDDPRAPNWTHISTILKLINDSKSVNITLQQNKKDEMADNKY